MEAFIDRLVDWKAFELFVADMYGEDPDLLVEHNVTETGKSGAKRQIDVRFTHHVKAHTYVTIVECKRWKDKVDRDRIDVLAATIEDLNASKGVMFTTTGFEPGAEAYAKQKGIDLFVVRDLTDEEWGLPGRVVWFYLHIYTAQIENFTPSKAELRAISAVPPASIELPLVFGPEEKLDPALTLCSTQDGSHGPNLKSVIVDARRQALAWLSPSVGLMEEGEDAKRSFAIPLEIDLSHSPHQLLMFPFGVVRLERLSMDLIVTVSQSRFEYDRAGTLDLAVAVENYVTRQRTVVSRQSESAQLSVDELGDPPPPGDDDDVLENGVIFSIVTEPYVTLDAMPEDPERTASLTFTLGGNTVPQSPPPA